MGRKTSPHPKQIAKRTSTDPSRRNRFIQTPSKGLVARNRYCSGKGGRRGNGESFMRCSLIVVRYPSFAIRYSSFAIRGSWRDGGVLTRPARTTKLPLDKREVRARLLVFWRSHGRQNDPRVANAEERTTDSTSTRAAASGVLRLHARLVFPRSPASWRSAGFL